MTADFVTTLQVLIAVRIEAVESGVINKNLVAGGKENSIVMEGDPAQTTAPPRPSQLILSSFQSIT